MNLLNWMGEHPILTVILVLSMAGSVREWVLVAAQVAELEAAVNRLSCNIEAVATKEAK